MATRAEESDARRLKYATILRRAVSWLKQTNNYGWMPMQDLARSIGVADSSLSAAIRKPGSNSAIIWRNSNKYISVRLSDINGGCDGDADLYRKSLESIPEKTKQLLKMGYRVIDGRFILH